MAAVRRKAAPKAKKAVASKAKKAAVSEVHHKKVKATRAKREPTAGQKAHQAFMSKHMKQYKKDHPASPQKDVMRAVSAAWKEHKGCKNRK